jgi:hypothetical protein
MTFDDGTAAHLACHEAAEPLETITRPARLPGLRAAAAAVPEPACPRAYGEVRTVTDDQVEMAATDPSRLAMGEN